MSEPDPNAISSDESDGEETTEVVGTCFVANDLICEYDGKIRESDVGVARGKKSTSSKRIITP